MAYEPHLTPASSKPPRVVAPPAARPIGFSADDDIGNELSVVPLSPVNYRLLIATVVCVGVCIGAVAALHSYQLDRLAGNFRALGSEAREAGDTAAAIEHLQRYLAIAPDDIDAIEDLAFSIADSSRTPAEWYRAVQLFERILRDSPNATSVRRRLVDLYRELAGYDATFSSDAVDHLNELLVRDPANPELRALRGESLEDLGRFLDARTDYEMAIESAPRHFEYYDRLVRVLTERLGKPDEALSRLNELVQRNPKDPDAYIARARFHWEQGRVRESRIDATRAYRLSENDLDVLVFLVTLMSYSDWPSSPVTVAELRDKLRAREADFATDRSTQLALVDLAILTGDYQEAQQRLDLLLDADPDLETARWLQADVLTLIGETEAAEKVIAEFQSSRGTGSSLAQFLRARNAFSRRDWPLAATLYREVFDGVYTGPFVRTIAGLNLATCYREMGQTMREQKVYTDVLSLNPDSADAVFGLAESHLRLGNLNEALRLFQGIRSPEASAAAALIVIEETLRRPESERRWDQVEEAVERAAEVQQDAANAALIRARQWVAQGRHQESVDLLTRTLKSSPGDVRLWTQLFETHLNRRDWEQAAAVLDQADAVLQRSGATLGSRITLAAFREDRESLEELTRTVSSLTGTGQDPVPRSVLARNLALAWQQLRELDRARECWELVRQDRPYDVSILEALLLLALGEADDAQAQLIVQQIRTIEGDSGIRWRIAEAERLIARAERGERQHLAAADEILRKLDEQSAPSAALSARRGDVARLQGDVESALLHYQSAIELGNASPDCIFHTANLLFQRGQFEDVSRLVRRFEQSMPLSLVPGLAQLGAVASLQENSVLEALRFAQLSADPDSPRFEDQISLGRFQQIAGQSHEAEGCFRRALELAPERPEPWVAYVAFLAAADRRDEAGGLIAQAEVSVARQSIHFTLAQCYDVLDDVEQAAFHYTRVAAESTVDPQHLDAAIRFFVRSGRRTTAIAILEPLLEDRPETTETSVVARRLLGAVLADSAEYRDRARALDLLNRNLHNQRGAAGREDRLLKSRVLAVSPLRRDRRAACDLLEQLRSEGLLPVRDAMQLAELHRTLGEPQAAVDQAVALVARTQRNPEILTWAIDLLLSQGPAGSHPEAVEQWLDLLTTLRPDAIGTSVLRSRWLISRGRPDEALRLLQEIPADRTSDESPDRTADVCLELALAVDRIAQELDRRGQLAEAEDFARFAEDLYRRAPESTNRSLCLVRFLIRRWRVDEAVAICRELRGSIPDEELARVSISLLQTHHVSPEQTADIRDWLQERCEVKGDSPTLVLCAAHAASLDGDYDAAVSLHRRVIELDPDNIESLNELALLLTLTSGASEEAMPLIDRAIDRAGPLGILLDTRATVALAATQLPLAERSALDAVAESPSAEFYFHLAQVQLAQGKREAARDSLRMGVRQGLHVNSVHPLEQPALKQLQSELGL